MVISPPSKPKARRCAGFLRFWPHDSPRAFARHMPGSHARVLARRCAPDRSPGMAPPLMPRADGRALLCGRWAAVRMRGEVG